VTLSNLLRQDRTSHWTATTSFTNIRVRYSYIFISFDVMQSQLLAVSLNTGYRFNDHYKIHFKKRGNVLIKVLLLFFFNLRTAAFQTYCAIWIRRSNFRHQALQRVSLRESTQRRKVKLWVKNVREFCLNADFHITFRDLLHAVKLRHATDGFTSLPKEGVLRIFFALKIRRHRPDANPRTWVHV
jgi:hypothetical protein